MLLGYGETLTNPVKLNRGGGEKNKPYSYSENKPVISAQLEELIEEINTLPLLAMPEGKAVAKFVLHPAFLAKSYFPVSLFERFSLESIGSKAVKVKPRKDIKKRGRRGIHYSVYLCFWQKRKFSIILRLCKSRYPNERAAK